MSDRRTDPALLQQAATLATEYLGGLADRPVGRPIEPDVLRAALGGPMPEHGEEPAEIVARLVRDMDRGLVATAGCDLFNNALAASATACW